MSAQTHRLPARRALLPAFLVSFLALALIPSRAAEDAGSRLESEGVAAQNYTRQHRAELSAVAAHRPWIWEVSKGKNRIWLAGCLHLGADPDQNLFPAYSPYYERAETLYFEVMPGGWETAEISTILSRRGYAPDRSHLSSRVTPGAWSETKIALRDSPALLEKITAMEPWFAALTITREGYTRAGLARDFSLEYFLEQRARMDKKPVGGLEQPQDQVYAMADSNLPDQEANLRSALLNFGKPDFGTIPIRRAWRSGNEAELKRTLNGGGALIADEMHFNLLTKRNQNWVRKIGSIFASGRSALIVVGAEHLVGEPQNLPSLLKAAGYTVQRAGSAPEPTPTSAAPAPHAPDSRKTALREPLRSAAPR